MFKDIVTQVNQGIANQKIDSCTSFDSTFVKGDLAYRKSVCIYLNI